MNRTDRFDQETIEQSIHTKWAGKTVHFAGKTDSTNRWIRELAASGAPHGTLAVTDYQSAGRGRFDRKWEAPPGTCVMMTLLLRPEIRPVNASMLTLVMGLSAAEAAGQLLKESGCGRSVWIKWPNDVVISRKKICGILTEMSVLGNRIDFVEIGIGINVNLGEFPEEMQDKATSLLLESGKTFDRSHVTGLVMERFEENYGKFVKTEDLTLLTGAYEKLLVNRGEAVRVLEKEPYEGTCLGISRRGELLVQSGEEVRFVNAGEVSVRGLYSYV